MNALLMMRTTPLSERVFAKEPPNTIMYDGDLLVILDGIKNDPDLIESLVGGLGEATITLGKIYAEDRSIRVRAHSPVFDEMRDRLADLYFLRAFPAAPHITLACSRTPEPTALHGLDLRILEGQQFTMNAVTISDDKVWYEREVSLTDPAPSYEALVAKAAERQSQMDECACGSKNCG